MADISSSSWSETDGNNNSASPNGWPSDGSMLPNQVEPSGRSMMGAIKRFWDRINGTVTSTGSAGAYVYATSNTSYPIIYVQGEAYTFKANFTSVGGDTLNVNSLGAKPLYKAGKTGVAAIAAGDIQSAQMVTAQYDSTLNGGSGGFQLSSVSAANLAASADLAAYLPLTGGTLTGTLAVSGAAFNEAQGADIASAATVNLDTATGNLVRVTGTTTITAITLGQGRRRKVLFTGALILTNGANLILPSGANITTAAGDVAEFIGMSSSVVLCTEYTRANGKPLITPSAATTSQAGIVALATAAITQAGTDNSTAVTPADLAATMLCGVGQTYQNVTGSRAANTAYYNTTPRPILVTFQASPNAQNGSIAPAVNGVNLLSGIFYADGYPFSFIVPPGASYGVYGSISVNIWTELS